MVQVLYPLTFQGYHNTITVQKGPLKIYTAIHYACHQLYIVMQVTAILKVSNHKLFYRDMTHHLADLELTLSKN